MKKQLLLTLIASLLMIACGNHNQGSQIHLVRLDQLLFQTPPAQLQSTLLSHASDYDTRLLNLNPTYAPSMQMLEEYVSDPNMRHIYSITDSLYHNLDWLESDLGQALDRAQKQLPELNYHHFYTLITGDFEDYSKRVFADQIDLAISLDHYSVKSMGGVVPAYIERLCTSEYMVSDCMGAIANAHIALPEGELTLLDYSIAEGKRLYFTKKALPKLPDTLLFRYSASQLRWAQAHTADVWSFLLREQLLYNHDLGQFHNLIDEAPKTNAFGDGSAPRMPAYIGFLIVQHYMSKTNSSMHNLFANTNSQQILALSGWRP